MPKTCPSCGHKGSGKFCSQCGASLDTLTCSSCGNQIPEGGRFCNMCGTAVGAAAGKGAATQSEAGGAASEPVAAGKGGPKRPPAGGVASEPAAAGGGASRNLPWIVAGVAILALGGVLLFQREDEATLAAPSLPAPVSAPAAQGPGAVDLSSMTPREAADRLFNRVMTAVSSGDTAQARQFAPMTISAYGMVEDLDVDGRYHLAMVHLVNGEPDQAMSVASSILSEVPTHLFGHFTAAEAEQMRGNDEAARTHYQHFLDNYADEMASGRTEYSDHAAVLPEMREQARQAVGGA